MGIFLVTRNCFKITEQSLKAFTCSSRVLLGFSVPKSVGFRSLITPKGAEFSCSLNTKFSKSLIGIKLLSSAHLSCQTVDVYSIPVKKKPVRTI